MDGDGEGETGETGEEGTEAEDEEPELLQAGGGEAVEIPRTMAAVPVASRVGESWDGRARSRVS